MRHIDPHAHPIHFLHEVVTEASQSAVVWLVTAGSDQVLLVVGQEHVSDTELIIKMDEI